MRAVIQRVSEASVAVDGAVTAAIGAGLLVLLGVTHADDAAVADRLADKVRALRLFPGTDGRMDAPLGDREVLVVSQFTLYGDVSGGRRPSWVGAARPDHAEPIVAAVVEGLRQLGASVATGRFRAEMLVSLVNDGPVTLIVEL